MKRSLGVIGMAGLVAAAGCSSTDGPTSAETATAPSAPAAVLADAVAIDEIALFQAVKTTLVAKGLSAEPNAPVIANRPALVRVFVKATGKTFPKVAAELRVKRAGKPDLVLTDAGKKALREVDDSLLESTLNFEIAAEDMTADATFSVKVGADLAATDVLTFPADGTAASFGAKTSSQTLKVKFVPVTYEAVEGASITPDLADLKTLKDTLYKLYPVANVEITVREPLKWSTVVKADGDGWDELLDGVMQLRRADQVERDVYYVGVLTPEASLDDFCSESSCVLGIAPQATDRDVGMRAALVLGYKNRGAGSTLAQELGHAMGRGHAPCGNPKAVDVGYPYPSGGIGVWGYDVLSKKLIDPGARYRDFMSYCSPTWTSDYTFAGLFERMNILTEQQASIDAGKGATPPAPGGSGGSGGGSGAAAARTELMQSFRIARDGSVHEGAAIEVLAGSVAGSAESSPLGSLRSPPSDVAVSYEGANGTVFASVKGGVRNISGTGGRIVLAPAAPRGTARARLAGGVTVLSARALAR